MLNIVASSRLVFALVALGGSFVLTCAGASEAPPTQPLFDQPAALLAKQPGWMGVFGIALSLFPLLLGWWLIRWTTALITAGVVGALVLFVLVGRVAPEWLWTAVLSSSALAGVAGWYLYPFLFALQMAALVGGITYGVLAHVAPYPRVIAPISGLLAALMMGPYGLRMAPYAAIAQTVVSGFFGILMGMVILCRPQGDGEHVVLAIVVGLITIPLGAWVQVRAHRRTQQL